MQHMADIDKGDSIRPNCRSKLACKETRWRSTIDVEDSAATFAATLPHEAFRLELSFLMADPMLEVESDDEVFMLLEISQSHLFTHRIHELSL